MKFVTKGRAMLAALSGYLAGTFFLAFQMFGEFSGWEDPKTIGSFVIGFLCVIAVILFIELD